jgi:hypothetical protein
MVMEWQLRGILYHARVAELADARDLGSRGQPWGFKSPLSHHYDKHLWSRESHFDDEDGSD